MESPHRLDCAETWASNQRTSSVADLPGLRVWVHSTPFGTGDAGGDVHYVSVCPSCIVSRIALADVSGHGGAVVSLSAKLRELMQKYLAALEQASLMRDLNEAVIDELDGVHYATMVAAGFHVHRGLLVMTNAGHPPAFWYRAKRDEWEWFEPQPVDGAEGVRGTPLGLLPKASYDRMTVKTDPAISSCCIRTVFPRPPTQGAWNWVETVSWHWRERQTGVQLKRSASNWLRPLVGFAGGACLRTTRPSSYCKGFQINRLAHRDQRHHASPSRWTTRPLPAGLPGRTDTGA